MAPNRPKIRHRRTVLRLSDLDHSKSAVLNSLTSLASRRTYEYAIEEFIGWYCSEPRLAFNRIVVTCYPYNWKRGAWRRPPSTNG